MYLKSLELAGFKSFASKAVLHFGSSITSIVGPNGSGKSNVAEAFQFVLGEQSIKSLRGKRGEDLIWNGGGGSAIGGDRANRASVKLVFDNSKKIFPTVDFDEVSIERVVHRDNSNDYILNGSHVRLKDITELLFSAHIGASRHHIISQGEADRILSASSRDRREMIEDALGLKVYQWKKFESIRKLEKTEDNMKQVESLRKEIAPHLKFLKKQVEKVEKADLLRNELITLYKEYFAYEEHYIVNEKRRLEQDMLAPRAELTRLDSSLEKAKKTLTDTKNNDKKTAKLIELEQALSALRADKDKIMRELGRIEGELSAHQKVIEREESRMKSEESRTVYLKDVENIVSKIESWSSVSDASKLFSDIIGVLRDFVSHHRVKSDSEAITFTRKEMDNFREEKERLEIKLSAIFEKEKAEKKEYEDVRGLIEMEKDSNRDAEKEVFRIIARQNEVRSTISSLESQLLTISHEEESFKKELGEAGILIGRDAVQYQSALELTSRNDQQGRLKVIEKIKIRLEDMGGGSTDILKEYRDTDQRDVFLAKELEDLTKAREELLKLITELDVRIDYEFKNGVLKINNEFQKFFALMFGGGKAQLAVVKEAKRRHKSDGQDLNEVLEAGPGEVPMDATEEESAREGLEVDVSLPRKKIKGVVMLSGGERALTSIALLFAISQVNPPPFIILDETDAALDEANSRKYGDMIESLSKQSQLILITHNRETMSRAGMLYGVTMAANGSSRLLSIAFDEAVKVAK